MTTTRLAEKLGFEIVNAGKEREISSVYCCDLLSIVMGRAPEDSVWVTVMGNINAVAVAVLADVSCVIVAEDMPADNDAILKAKSQGVCLLRSPLKVFDIALEVHKLL